MDDLASGGAGLSTARLVGLGLGWMGSVALPALLVSVLAGGGLGLGVAIVLALWVSGTSASRHPALPVAAVLGCAVGAFGGRAAELSLRPHAPVDLATPEDLRDADGVGVLRFRDAHVELARVGLQSLESSLGAPIDRGRPPESAWSVAPIVGAAWRPEEPVRVWALCEEAHGSECRESWSEPLRGGLRAAAEARPERCALAIDDATAAYALTSAPDALCVRWVEDPGAARRDLVGRPLLAALLVVASWIAGVPLLRLHRRRRLRAAAAEESSRHLR